LSVPTSCTIHRFLMDPIQIHYLRFVLEAYEGMAILSTIDRKLGLVQLNIAPGCERDLDAILHQEREFLKYRPIDIENRPDRPARSGEPAGFM